VLFDLGRKPQNPKTPKPQNPLKMKIKNEFVLTLKKYEGFTDQVFNLALNNWIIIY